ATTHGISLPAGTEMFHFPAFPPHALYIQARVAGHDPDRVSPFGHPRITARLPTPRGISQATTSFIGSWCQGIHRMLFTTSQHKKPQKSKMLASTVQFSSYRRSHPARPPTSRRPRRAAPNNKQTRSLPGSPTVCPHHHTSPTTQGPSSSRKVVTNVPPTPP